MRIKKIPYQKTIFVCVNVRSDGRVACANEGRGGDKIRDALKQAIKAQGLQGKIRIAKSGCLNLCAQGPNIFIYPDGKWYCHVQQKDVGKILSQILKF